MQFRKSCYVWLNILAAIQAAAGAVDSSTEVVMVSVATSSSRALPRRPTPRPASTAPAAPAAPAALDDSLLEAEGSGEDPRVPAPRAQDKNETREALKPDSSDQDPVLFLSEKTDYIPVSIRPRSPAAGAGVATGAAGAVVGAAGAAGAAREPAWEREYRRHRSNGSRVQYIEAECQDDFMKIRVGFNGSFSGLVYSAGYSYDPDCMYIDGSGRDYYEFYIQLNRCGTLGRNAPHDDARNHPTKNLMWNTITVQYNPLIEEELDEHFKVTCEYGYDFWKTVTFPFLDVEVATGNPVVFTLQPPECYMEIRAGYGAGGARVAGPVRVGDPLTLLIYMRSDYDGFDIVVNDCFAHNGASKKIQLIDENGCPVDDKLISRFRGSWSESGAFETQVYAYMKTFRFTGSPALYIECDVRMCHGRCPTQPCHWRNMKSVRKRSAEAPAVVGAEAGGGGAAAGGGVAAAGGGGGAGTLSENISLFQSLRVLQEGEEDADKSPEQLVRSASETCLQTWVMAATLAAGGALLFALAGGLLLTRRRLRAHAHRTPLHTHTYVHHKGRIK